MGTRQKNSVSGLKAAQYIMAAKERGYVQEDLGKIRDSEQSVQRQRKNNNEV